jgi:hypothetical protein
MKFQIKESFNFRISKEDKPKSKEDFQRLYAELESWRLKQEKKISESMKPGLFLETTFPFFFFKFVLLLLCVTLLLIFFSECLVAKKVLKILIFRISASTNSCETGEQGGGQAGGACGQS